MVRVKYALIFIFAIIGLSTLLPLSKSFASSPSISNSYTVAAPIPIGSLVSLQQNKKDAVEPSNTSNGSRLIGISVQPNSSLIEVNSSPNAVQVATYGTVNALVSTINGNISIGDKVSVSPINGIGMKAGVGYVVIGYANQGFSSTTSGAKKYKVSSSSSPNKEVVVGYIPISIAIGYSVQSDQSLSGLDKIATEIIGRPISNLRIVISLLIFLIAITSVVALIYSSIYSTIVSIGRNPLAKYEVMRILTRVMGMVLIISGISSLIIYLILR